MKLPNIAPTRGCRAIATIAALAHLATLAAAFALPPYRASAETPPPETALCAPDPATPLTCLLYDTGRSTGQPRALGPLALPLPPPWTTADYLLLGEVHDNPTHHAIRARLLTALAAARPGLAAAFEQLRADTQPALDAFNATGGTVDELLAAVAWDKSPWSKMSDYRPLFAAATGLRLPVLAADPSREAIRKAAKDGLAAALDDATRTRLGLDVPLGEAADDASRAEIEAAHCGAIPAAALPGMMAAQRYRDASQADALLARAGPAVLFAGNGHVRADRGVPWYLRRRAPDRQHVTVMLREVEPGKLDPADYVERGPDGRPVTDYILLTAAAPHDPDPCAAMRSRK